MSSPLSIPPPVLEAPLAPLVPQALEALDIPEALEGPPPRSEQISLTQSVVQNRIADALYHFRNSIGTSSFFILFSNALVIWILEQSTSLKSMLFPLCFHILLTGSFLTLVVQRRVLFQIQLEIETFRYKDLAKKYHQFIFFSLILLPCLTLICAVSLFHVSLDVSFHIKGTHTCATSYLTALDTLSPMGKTIVSLYSATLVILLISSWIGNYFASILSSAYISEYKNKCQNLKTT
jgi:hypothetical protein